MSEVGAIVSPLATDSVEYGVAEKRALVASIDVFPTKNHGIAQHSHVPKGDIPRGVVEPGHNRILIRLDFRSHLTASLDLRTRRLRWHVEESESWLQRVTALLDESRASIATITIIVVQAYVAKFEVGRF